MCVTLSVCVCVCVCVFACVREITGKSPAGPKSSIKEGFVRHFEMSSSHRFCKRSTHVASRPSDPLAYILKKNTYTYPYRNIHVHIPTHTCPIDHT